MEKIETAENNKGLCAVCASKDVCVTASPVLPVGSVRVIHFDKNSKNVTIKAHQSALSAISLSTEGHLLATASIQV